MSVSMSLKSEQWIPDGESLNTESAGRC